MEAVTNFRDIGGKSGAGGKKVKERQFLRSGDLHELTEQDRAVLLNEYSLQTIVDFRSAAEKKDRPDIDLPGVTYVPIDVLADIPEQNGSLESMLTANTPPDTLMKQVYKNLVLTKSAQLGYRQFLELLLNESEVPVVFHCFAGKDRTGFAAALVLKLLGVSEEDIYKDYLRTNEMRKEANKEMLRQLQALYHLSDDQAARIAPMLDVKKEYLQSVFTAINEQYGDFETYVTDVLRFSPEKIQQLQELYLV